ncbi:MAG: TIGR00730 family Rossman fold protein [Candidatus Gastranaerophilales bacterium]|nr:TIGR00730 family Rossman fold protein [Candidatus Gastranaerophilales bacterium]
MKKKICIYCSSSDEVDLVYFQAAKELAALVAAENHTLVYGGASVGLMGEIAKTAHSFGGKVVGVIPKGIKNMGVAYEAADEFIVTKDLRERKSIMETFSDAFIALPGGFGTLEEMLEMITLKQLNFHNKPLVFLNINDFYKPLFDLFEHVYNSRFANSKCRNLYYIASDPKSAIKYIEDYIPEEISQKVFKF